LLFVVLHYVVSRELFAMQTSTMREMLIKWVEEEQQATAFLRRYASKLAAAAACLWVIIEMEFNLKNREYVCIDSRIMKGNLLLLLLLLAQ